MAHGTVIFVFERYFADFQALALLLNVVLHYIWNKCRLKRFFYMDHVVNDLMVFILLTVF